MIVHFSLGTFSGAPSLKKWPCITVNIKLILKPHNVAVKVMIGRVAKLRDDDRPWRQWWRQYQRMMGPRCQFNRLVTVGAERWAHVVGPPIKFTWLSLSDAEPSSSRQSQHIFIILIDYRYIMIDHCNALHDEIYWVHVKCSFYPCFFKKKNEILIFHNSFFRIVKYSIYQVERSNILHVSCLNASLHHFVCKYKFFESFFHASCYPAFPKKAPLLPSS